jgi:hypothetical protein
VPSKTCPFNWLADETSEGHCHRRDGHGKAALLFQAEQKNVFDVAKLVAEFTSNRDLCHAVGLRAIYNSARLNNLNYITVNNRGTKYCSL